MATPTRAEVQSQWSNAVALLKATKNFGISNSPNWIGLEDTAIQSLESELSDEIASAIFARRTDLQNVLANSSDLQRPHLKSYAVHILRSPELTDPQLILNRLYQDFIDNTLRVNSRQFTFGTPSAITGTGNGVIFRLTKDENNFDLEAQHPDLKTAECIRDQNSGASKFEEVFEIRGQTPGKDALAVSGSGLVAEIRAVSARDSQLLNPSFSTFVGTSGTPTTITNWTSSITVSGNYTMEQLTANVYRGFPGDTTPTALRIKATATLSQKISLRGYSVDPAIPHVLQLAYNREIGSATGTLLVRMGNVNTSVAISAQTGWNILRVPSSFGQNNWFKNFDEQDLDISIEWTRTAGDIIIDDVLFVQMTKFDGSWYVILPDTSTSTPFLRGDKSTWSDTAANENGIQYWLWRGFDRYLPSATGGSVTFADPT